MDVRDLPRQRIRHRWPVRLVLLELHVSEGGPLLVERDGQVRGATLADDLLQHRGESVDGIRRKPRRGGEIGKSEEGAVEVGAAVNEVEDRAFRHQAHRSTACWWGQAGLLVHTRAV